MISDMFEYKRETEIKTVQVVESTMYIVCKYCGHKFKSKGMGYIINKKNEERHRQVCPKIISE